jgi:hypothetical protein
MKYYRFRDVHVTFSILRRKSQNSDIPAGKGCSGVIAQTNPLAKISLWCQNMNHASDRIIG